jgi:hypothetical protein
MGSIYTESRLMNFIGWTPFGVKNDLDWLGTSSETVIATLDRLGIRYFIWDRNVPRTELIRSTILSTDFLRAHTRILEAARGVYFFEVLPDASESWGASSQNLLKDPGLDTVGNDGPWRTDRRAKARKGVITMTKHSSTLKQEVPASAGSPYLLLAEGRCADPERKAALMLRWLDANGAEVGTEKEWVIPGIEWSEQFLWRNAPDRATAVSVEVTEAKGCEFDEIALYGPS